ncbi:MAG: transglycosylase family protein, partial [Acidimicrobiaceae bacterium]|nr:transglycosylase family protein [Acidimicrobiaceae bacterium]
APPPTTAPPAAPATTAAAPAGPISGSLATDVAELRTCESGGSYATNTGNGFYGAYQLSQQAWTDLGYPGRPDLEPPAMQDQAAVRLATTVGWSQWPACSAELGLSGVA